MQTLETLKRSIKNADDLATVVRTMKTMAAVSIRQYETATESLDVYSRTIETGLRMVLSHMAGAGQNKVAAVIGGTSATPPPTIASGFDSVMDDGPPVSGAAPFTHAHRKHLPHNAMPPRAATAVRTGAVIFGSDQGMCGQFNEQIARFAVDTLSPRAGGLPQIPAVLCVGHRVSDTLANLGIPVIHSFRLPGSAGGITSLVQDLLPAIDEWRGAHDIDRIQVFHNRRLSASTWRPYHMQLLPLHPERLQHQATESAEPPGRSLPQWSMDTNLLFSRLVKQFLFVSLFRACAESLAGENASRIAAMQAAERNIRDRLHLLRADYAARRQTTITEELLDVVTGFEALKQE